ncbi:hypothetical protein BFP72_07670 [Reichenbachiella sp. 5M10]|nr:hypothetical protein BFP72_07670 [Reichenbachiella sp. 5M10]
MNTNVLTESSREFPMKLDPFVKIQSGSLLSLAYNDTVHIDVASSDDNLKLEYIYINNCSHLDTRENGYMTPDEWRDLLKYNESDNILAAANGTLYVGTVNNQGVKTGDVTILKKSENCVFRFGIVISFLVPGRKVYGIIDPLIKITNSA